jgi:hypothetical protein
MGCTHIEECFWTTVADAAGLLPPSDRLAQPSQQARLLAARQRLLLVHQPW